MKKTWNRSLGQSASTPDQGMRWLPTTCALCRVWGDSVLCPACRQDHARIIPRCPGCAHPLAPGLTRCSRCAQDGPGALAACMARVAYAWPWDDIVARFKFRAQPAWARELARLMLDDPQIVTALAAADGLIPIPLAPSRLRERGFNQAAELARQLGRRLHRPVRPHALLRRETQRTQHELDRAERQAHARLAFAVAAQERPHIAGRHWILVDDVMTTGATLQAAAQRLREAGAASVGAVVFARTPAPSAQHWLAEPME